MSHADHEWAKEQIAAHLAGGLSAEERARLEAHAASCAECIAEIDAARRFDRRIEDLFLPVRAKAGLEERIIQKLRFAPVPKQRSFAGKLTLAAASLLVTGVLGYVFVEMDAGRAPFEGGTETVAQQEGQSGMSGKSYFGFATARPTDAGGVPAATFSLQSADQLARRRELSELSVLSLKDKASELGRFAPETESDYRESDDGVTRAYQQGPGSFGGKGLRGAAAATPPPSPSAPPPPAAKPGSAGEPVLALQENRRSGGFSYRNDAPAQQPADAERFKPEELKQLAAKGDANRAEGLAKAVEERAKDGRSNEFKGRMLANAEKAGQDKPQAGNVQADPQQPPQPAQRKVIRTGEVEYEIESFDTSVATISKLVEEEAGYIGTVNSDKLPNGKVRGVVVLRCPPERLDTLLLKLRGLGELKSQNIRSQDVGKQYFDLESRIRAARTMEERLLKIIKEGKGEIKDLLLAEKELGEWRTKLEMYEGEKRYYDNQIGMSTLTVTLSEKEIRSASAVTETERIDTGIEVEDVEKAHKAALAAIVEAKGRVTKSDLKQLAAGQYSALIHFEVTPEAAGPLRDRLKQLGNVARLDITRVQETEGGVKVIENLKVRQKDTQFFVSIYNLANVAPRETVVMTLAAADAEASYKQILARIEKAAGRVVTSSLNRQKNDQTTGQLRFEIKSAEAEAALLDIRTYGEVMRLDVLEAADTQNVTKSKKGFQVQIFAMGLVEPRETTTITIASKDVPAAYRALQDAVAGAEARILTAQLNENDRQNVNASLYFDYRRDNDAKISAALAAAGDVLNRSASRAQDVERVVDSKRRLNLTLVNIATIAPREIYTLAIEAEPVEGAVTALEALASELKGRIIDSRHTRGSGGRNISKVTIDLPFASARAAADKVKGMGHVRIFDMVPNLQAPDGPLAVGRIEVTVSNPSQLVDSESTPWTRIKSGLSVGLTALSWSLTLVIVGLCFLVPLGLIVWVGRKVYLRTKVKAA